MWNLRTLRAIGLVLGGLLAGLAVSVAPNPASSERGTYQLDNPDGWGGITQVPADDRPMRVLSRLFPNSDDCAAVKLDVWINRGLLTYSLFNNPDAGTPPTDTVDEPGRTTMLIGGKDCLIRVRIERAPNPSGDN